MGQVHTLLDNAVLEIRRQECVSTEREGKKCRKLKNSLEALLPREGSHRVENSVGIAILAPAVQSSVVSDDSLRRVEVIGRHHQVVRVPVVIIRMERERENTLLFGLPLVCTEE